MAISMISRGKSEYLIWLVLPYLQLDVKMIFLILHEQVTTYF